MPRPPSLATADINVGVTVSATGPAASLGIPEKNTIALMPQTIGGQKVNYIVLDDASDTTTAVTNTRKLITENKVDVLLGSTTTPNSLAMIDVAAESQTPMISMAASAAIVEPIDAKRKWVFKTPQNDIMMSLAIATHMAAGGRQDGRLHRLLRRLRRRLVSRVRQDRAAQGPDDRRQRALRAHRHLGHRPGAQAQSPPSPTRSWSPPRARRPRCRRRTLKERGYAGKFYQTHGVANNDFLRVGGKDVEGTFLPAGPVLVATQLPARNPVRASALDYVDKYEAAYGKGIGLDLRRARLGRRPADGDRRGAMALKKAQPGTPEFRAALRDALEQRDEVPGAHGIFNMSPTDHLGLDQRARVMVKIENGAWNYQP